jgi:intracellular sulfur oxidation DsrE/DsrF family protein
MERLKVVFHVNNPTQWDTALGNITNLLKDVGDDGATVVVLTNGPSVKAYADEGLVEKMKTLAERGVSFRACRNSLKNLCAGGEVCLNEESLPEFIQVVPAGITELIRLQMEGFAYVKP